MLGIYGLLYAMYMSQLYFYVKKCRRNREKNLGLSVAPARMARQPNQNTMQMVVAPGTVARQAYRAINDGVTRTHQADQTSLVSMPSWRDRATPVSLARHCHATSTSQPWNPETSSLPSETLSHRRGWRNRLLTSL
jgi:hypothetical protein